MNLIIILLAIQIAGFVFYKSKDIQNRIELSDANFIEYTGITRNITKNSFIFVYSPNCPHCKKHQQTINELTTLVDTNQVGIYSLDCTENRLVCRQLKIKRFPTFLYFTTDNKIFEYARQKTTEELVQFVTQGYKGDFLKDYQFNSFKADPIYNDIAYIKAAVINFIVIVGGPIQTALITFFATLAIFSIFGKLFKFCFNKKTQVQDTKKKE